MANNARLFLVEDHPTTARALKMLLETQGYTVSIAGDVSSALKKAVDWPFDLLICDLSLPDGTGWDLMKKLSAKRPVRGIAFTAADSAEEIARSQRVGFIKHIVKGCPAEELTAVVAEALRTEPKKPRARANQPRKTAKS